MKNRIIKIVIAILEKLTKRKVLLYDKEENIDLDKFGPNLSTYVFHKLWQELKEQKENYRLMMFNTRNEDLLRVVGQGSAIEITINRIREFVREFQSVKTKEE